MDFTPLVVFGVLLVRIGMLVATTPLFGAAWAPMQVKVGLTAILAVVLMPFVALPTLASPAALTMVIAHEAVVGLALSFSVRILVAAAELGGYLVGFQLGFSYAGIIDPQSGVRNNVMAVLYGSLTALAHVRHEPAPPGHPPAGRDLRVGAHRGDAGRAAVDRRHRDSHAGADLHDRRPAGRAHRPRAALCRARAWASSRAPRRR